MNVKRRIWLSMATTILSATALSAQDVKTDYDRNVDFSQYKTYSWANIRTESLWTDRIRDTVSSALSAKGWTRVESEGDITIMAMEMTAERRTLKTYYDTFGGGWGARWGGGWGTATTTEQTYTVGTLVLDLFDTKTRMLVWRGSASDTLSSKSDRNIKKLEKGVHKMFAQFPPRLTSRTNAL